MSACQQAPVTAGISSSETCKAVSWSERHLQHPREQIQFRACQHVHAGGGASNGRPPSFSSFKASSFPAAGVPLFGGASRDFESMTLEKMRQIAERDRLIAEEKAKDEAEAEAL